jgi:hypothetical protein
MAGYNHERKSYFAFGRLKSQQERDAAMRIGDNLPITDGEWEKLKNSPFEVSDFVEALKRFDSVRHFAGASEIAGTVHANIHKAGELAGKFFDEGQRDSVYELFFQAASLDSLTHDMEGWLAYIRDAFASLNKIRPESLSVLDDDNTE